MNITKCSIEGVRIIEPDVYEMKGVFSMKAIIKKNIKS